MAMRRYLVMWYDGSAGTNRASIVDDNEDSPKLPFVDESAISDDCDDITAVILCADAPNVPYVVLDGQEVEWPDAAREVTSEYRVIHDGDDGTETDAGDEDDED